uniref:DUF4283 domain-containing protein n=1 Tax=Cannabis sativa TaxID=3483 RepID=A0A803Q0W0_CANSA
MDNDHAVGDTTTTETVVQEEVRVEESLMAVEVEEIPVMDDDNGCMDQEAGELDDMRQHFFDSMTLELEPDVELSAEVTRKGVLAKIFRKRNVARGRVKEILSNIWNVKGKWRMKTLSPGLWEFFFDNEDDKKEILKKRPWLVNGVLLNIRDWPEDGCWDRTDMNKARYWVEAHGLPTPYLTWENTDVIVRKVGEYVDFDRAPRNVIARRGFLKFQNNGICLPPVGKAVPLYGAWIKVGVPIKSYFDPSILRMKPIAYYHDAGGQEAVQGNVGLRLSPKKMAVLNAKKACVENQRKTPLSSKRGLQGQRSLSNIKRHPMNYIDNRLRDAGIIASLMADIGPSRDQKVDRPHEEVCKSRVPHQHPEPTFVTWPTDKSLDEVVDQLVGPAHKEHELVQVIVSHESGDFSTTGPVFTGAKIRKKSLNIIPVISEKEEAENLGDKAPTPVTFLPPLEGLTINDNKNQEEKGEPQLKGGGPYQAPSVDMRLLSWNCWGVRRTPATQALLAWARRYKPECIFLMETKTNVEGINGLARLLRYQFSSIIPSVGVGGGFFLLWNDGVDLKFIDANDGVFEVEIVEQITSVKWRLFTVYGRPYENKKKDFWDMIEVRIGRCSEPRMVIGDLNLIANPWEKCGGRRVSSSDTDILSNFMQNTGGIDSGFHGSKFIWQNNRFLGGLTRERLDRAVVSGDWITAFPSADVFIAPVTVSDHAFILLDSNGRRRKGVKPFRFFEVWVRENSCEVTIKKAWEPRDGRRVNIYGRLSDTRTALQRWKKESFGDCDRMIKEAENRLKWIQSQPFSMALQCEEANLLNWVSELWIRKEGMWRQKSREV